MKENWAAGYAARVQCFSQLCECARWCLVLNLIVCILVWSFRRWKPTSLCECPTDPTHPEKKTSDISFLFPLSTNHLSGREVVSPSEFHMTFTLCGLQVKRPQRI